MRIEYYMVIVDDRLPRNTPGFDTLKDYELVDQGFILSALRHVPIWDDKNLQALTKLITDSPYFQENRIKLNWAYHPGICLEAISNGYEPNWIVYDWEYDIKQDLNTVISNLTGIAE